MTALQCITLLYTATTSRHIAQRRNEYGFTSRKRKTFTTIWD